MWSVYLLLCRDNSLYCGVTNNLKKRLAAHKKGKVKYTRGRLPVEIVYNLPVDSKSAALREEHRVKKLTRVQKEELITKAFITWKTISTSE